MRLISKAGQPDTVALQMSETRRIIESVAIMRRAARNVDDKEASGIIILTADSAQKFAKQFGAKYFDEDGELKVSGREQSANASAPE